MTGDADAGIVLATAVGGGGGSWQRLLDLAQTLTNLACLVYIKRDE